jgi:hypothetical protein
MHPPCNQPPDPKAMFQGEMAGTLVIVSGGDRGETHAMTSYRAWAVAHALALNNDVTLAECASSARVWVWSEHVGCTYNAHTPQSHPSDAAAADDGRR